MIDYIKRLVIWFMIVCIREANKFDEACKAEKRGDI